MRLTLSPDTAKEDKGSIPSLRPDGLRGTASPAGDARLKSAPLAAFLRQAREARGKSMRQIANRSGVTLNTVWNLEHGRTSNPTVSTLVAMARALHADPMALFAAAIGAPANDQQALLQVVEREPCKPAPVSPQPQSLPKVPLGRNEIVPSVNASRHRQPSSWRGKR